ATQMAFGFIPVGRNPAALPPRRGGRVNELLQRRQPLPRVAGVRPEWKQLEVAAQTQLRLLPLEGLLVGQGQVEVTRPEIEVAAQRVLEVADGRLRVRIEQGQSQQVVDARVRR